MQMYITKNLGILNHLSLIYLKFFYKEKYIVHIIRSGQSLLYIFTDLIFQYGYNLFAASNARGDLSHSSYLRVT